MGLLELLGRLLRPFAPRRTLAVRFDDEGVVCVRSNGRDESVRWEDLRAVFIQTTAAGPAVDDLFWVLVGREGGCVVPSEALGCDQLLRRLQELPGFNNRAVIEAAACVDDRRFVCWRHPDHEAIPP